MPAVDGAGLFEQLRVQARWPYAGPEVEDVVLTFPEGGRRR